MATIKLKVVLPTGDVTVPVEPLSTPGHLKENLKYSLRVPPKLILLTHNGRELDDIKPFEGEPNNVRDGATIIAQRKEALTAEEEAEAAKAAAEAKEDKPVVIKKEEAAPKPKKPKKDVARPVVADGDVVKTKTLKQGRQAWKPEFLDGRHPKRHLAFLRIEVVSTAKGPSLAPKVRVRIVGLKAKPELNGAEGCVEKFDEEKGRWQTRLSNGKMLEVKPDNLEVDRPQGKAYPENDPHGSVVFALGDPQTAPAWTAAALQMEIGEKAEFTMAKKVVDFDPDGLTPTDSTTTWRVELVRIIEVIDVLEDFSQLLHVANSGGPQRAEDLDDARAHWRVRRWMAEGNQCIASSRERIAIMPGQGLVNIEDQHAPPVTISVGEGQQKALETVASRVGPGGTGHLYLKTEALNEGRPAGCVVFEVDVVEFDPNRGPSSAGWRGWQSLLLERERGDRWLEEADSGRKNLETFGTLQKSTGGTKESENSVAEQVHKFAYNASRRYRRALRWIDEEDQMDDKRGLEKTMVTMRLAKASALGIQRFGGAAEAEASEEEKEALSEAQALLKQALKHCEHLTKNKDALVYECLSTSLQVSIQAQEVADAKRALEDLTKMRPDNGDEFQSHNARINRLENVLALKNGANAIESTQRELQEAVAGQDKTKVAECLTTIFDMLVNSQVTWEKVRTCKVGKDVGNAMKMGDADISKQGRNVVQEIQQLAQRAGIGL